MMLSPDVLTCIGIGLPPANVIVHPVVSAFAVIVPLVAAVSLPSAGVATRAHLPATSARTIPGGVAVAVAGGGVVAAVPPAESTTLSAGFAQASTTADRQSAEQYVTRIGPPFSK